MLQVYLGSNTEFGINFLQEGKGQSSTQMNLSNQRRSQVVFGSEQKHSHNHDNKAREEEGPNEGPDQCTRCIMTVGVCKV